MGFPSGLISKAIAVKIFTISGKTLPIYSDTKPQPVESANANKWFRWNLLWFLLICVLLVPLPLWVYAISCLAGFVVICTLNAWMCVVLLLCMMNASRTMWTIYRAKGKSWSNEESGSQMTHLVVMCGYKEPIEVMITTLDSMKAQTVAKRLFVVVGLEQNTPNFEEKQSRLIELYGNVFCHFMVTRHPRNVPGEIPGKCSNSNYAARQGVEKMKELKLYDLQSCTATTCDTDNIFQPSYFEYLGFDFQRRADRAEVVWQAPLFYNYQLDRRPFFVRVTGVLRAVFMMGFLVPQSINTMSVFSMSLELLEKGNYFHPMYQMDDIINKLTRMISIRKDVRIVLIPSPVISGPTSGETLCAEIIEWARQARRWTIGAAEVFHYLCVKLGSFSGWTGVSYAFVFSHYYGFVMCAMSLMNIVGLVSSLIYAEVGLCVPATYLGSAPLAYVPLFGLAFSYLIFAWIFMIDAFATRLLEIREDISCVRNALHWLSTPLVLLAYSCVEYYAIVELAIFGKAVCKHGSSKKMGLVTIA